MNNCDRKCNNANCCKIFKVPLYGEDFVHFDYNFFEENGEYFLNKNNKGECIYLKNNKCSIYNNRPITCKEYNCNI